LIEESKVMRSQVEEKVREVGEDGKKADAMEEEDDAGGGGGGGEVTAGVGIETVEDMFGKDRLLQGRLLRFTQSMTLELFVVLFKSRDSPISKWRRQWGTFTC
jgi:hypothetical protein